MDYSNESVYGGFELYKVDKETMISYALGGASLQGIEFTLKNESANTVHVPRGKEGKDYRIGEVIPDP